MYLSYENTVQPDFKLLIQGRKSGYSFSKKELTRAFFPGSFHSRKMFQPFSDLFLKGGEGWVRKKLPEADN